MSVFSFCAIPSAPKQETSQQFEMLVSGSETPEMQDSTYRQEYQVPRSLRRTSYFCTSSPFQLVQF